MTPTQTTQSSTPREIDTQLSELHVQAYKVEDSLARSMEAALHSAGAEFYYQGRRRVTDMKVSEAEAILAADIAANTDDKYGYRLVRKGYSIGGIRTTVANLAELRAARAALLVLIEELEQSYTGWSRFFLVTSSKGHIHSSMHCSTCRPTTTYGWLPQLSGRTEADCVEEFGPALCSVCYPTAPVEWTTEKLTKARAVKAAA